VLKREHSLKDEKLHVSVYYKELGVIPPGIDVSSPFEAVPSDIAMNCSPEITKFILQNQSLKQKVSTHDVHHMYVATTLSDIKIFVLQKFNASFYVDMIYNII